MCIDPEAVSTEAGASQGMPSSLAQQMALAAAGSCNCSRGAGYVQSNTLICRLHGHGSYLQAELHRVATAQQLSSARTPGVLLPVPFLLLQQHCVALKLCTKE